MHQKRIHIHPHEKQQVEEGCALEPMEVIESNDLYPDPDGTWKKCGSALKGFKAQELIRTYGLVIRPMS